MTLVVPDASLILKWVVPPDNEPHVEHAFSLREAFFLRDEITLQVPALWYFEVGNTLARKFPLETQSQLHHLRHLGMTEMVMDDHWQETILALIRNHGVTFYDACYHALAILLGGTFITADEKYLNRVKGTSHILHLQNWPLE